MATPFKRIGPKHRVLTALVGVSFLCFAGAASAQQTVDPGSDLFDPDLLVPQPGFEGEPSVETLDAPVEMLAPPADVLDPPGLDFPVTIEIVPLPSGRRHDLVLEARLVAEGHPVAEGLLWRVFGIAPGADGHLPLFNEARGGTTTIELPSGDYLVYAAFGRAGATKRVTVADKDQRESLVLDAGGLVLNSVVGGEPIGAEKLKLEIMQEEDAGLVTVVPNATPDRVVRLSAGTYHVVSRYGDVNAIVRADIEVEAGKLTEATMHHIGAEITLKLVSEAGGEAIANTNWAVITGDGTTVHESIGAFSSLVLAAGEYTAVATHQDRIYSRDFTVEAGVERDIEVRLSDLVQPETGEPQADADPPIDE